MQAHGVHQQGVQLLGARGLRDEVVGARIERGDLRLQGGGVLNDMMCHSALLVRHLLTGETVSPAGQVSPVRIGVLQVWQKQGGDWVLLARQAYRL